MKVRLERGGMANMFRLSKLGQECGNEYFMDKDGNPYELTSGPNQPRRVRKLSMFWPALFDRARAHPDWDADTMDLS